MSLTDVDLELIRKHFPFFHKGKTAAQIIVDRTGRIAQSKAVPDAVDREGLTVEEIEAEQQEADLASERLKQISAQRAADRDANWHRKQALETARRARHKGKDRTRKKEPTRKVRQVVYNIVSLDEIAERENNFADRS